MATKKVEDELLRLQKNMYNFAYSLTLNSEDADDLLQDTSLRVLDNQEKFAENTNFKGWVLTVMKNIFINNYRKIVRNQTMIDQTEDLYHLNVSQESSMITPDSLCVMNELIDGIEHLPEEFRTPFQMHIDGYKYEEIAEEMNLPIGTVKSRIFWARKKLQKDFVDYKL
ncbi:MAG: RNA polymerase sigma factor [Paludibacteraceae bacterium]|nr:RNA polymerase sigma factor [Paludibacteraceae bacterium]